MPATTRSGAPTAAPAVANKATKATQAKKSGAKGRNASQAKVNKANTTTNRVQKPISTGRNARGYVWVDEASHTVDDTSRTASPDFIPGIPPPSRRVVPETPPPSSQAEYEAEIARLRRKLQHRRRQPRRHRRSGREDSEAESSDTEAGDHPRVSFLHQTGNKPFLTLHEHYPAVNIMKRSGRS